MVHVAEWKYKEVEELTSLLTCRPVIGIVEVGGIPAPQLQQMRSTLRDNAILRSAKNTLIIRALENADKTVKGIKELEKTIDGQTVILATNLNPFKLFQLIKNTKTMAPAKGGEIATHDIVVNAGETPFKPGPIVGELQKAGIPAAIEDGKVMVKADKTIVSAGEKINPEVAKMFTRMDIFPVEIGMVLHAAYENGTIFMPEVLDVNVDGYLSQVNQASRDVFNLAIQMAWVTKVTVQCLLRKAHTDALALALEQNIITKDTVNALISKAQTNMIKLASKVPDALDEKIKNMLGLTS